MGQLTNQYVSSSYQGLLKMTDSTTGVTGTLQTVQSGDGTNSPLQISQTQVNISGSFFINNVPITNGTNGTSGTSGVAGSSGTSGSSGSNGSSGTSGQSGSSGSAGSDGSSGTSGTSGSNGSSGTSGVDGSSGTSGSNGSDGSSGTSGVAGSSGTSGTSFESPYTGDIIVTGSIDITGQFLVNGVPVTGSGGGGDRNGLITTGSVTDTQQITGSLILGNTVISGSLVGNTVNGGFIKITNEAFLSGTLQLNVTSSNAVSQSNILFQPAPPNAAIASQLTGSIVISGSNNILFNPFRTQNATQTANGIYGYIGGGNNIVSQIPLFTTASLTQRPTMNNNQLNGLVSIGLITSSVASSVNNNLVYGSIVFNSQSGSVSYTNNINNSAITLNQNTQPLTGSGTRGNTFISQNNFGGSTTLNAVSSSIQATGNITFGSTFVTNSYYHTGSNSFVNLASNLIGGNNNHVQFGGNPATNAARSFSTNILGGGNNIVNLDATGSEGNVFNAIIFGNNLSVNPKETITGLGVFGRWNKPVTGSTIFVVGNGTSAGDRRNAIEVTTNNQTLISGSVKISGSLNTTDKINDLTIWTGSANVNSIAIGNNTLAAATGSSLNNIAIGNNALKLNVTGSNIVAIGGSALENSLQGFNTAIGASALGALVAGEQNMAIGQSAIQALTDGGKNTAIGFNTMVNVVSGSNNTAIGAGTLQRNVNGNGCVVIGNQAGSWSTTSNEFFIHNDNLGSADGERSGSLMWGNFANPISGQNLQINANTNIRGTFSVNGVAFSNGSNGTSGTSGSNGSSGTSGLAGSSGTSGTSPSIVGFITTGSVGQTQNITGSLTVSGSNVTITGTDTNNSSNTFVLVSGSMKMSDPSGSIRIATANNQPQLFFNSDRKVGFFLGQSNMDQVNTQFGITDDSTDNYTMGGNFNNFRTGSVNLMLGVQNISLRSGSHNIILAKDTAYNTGSNNLILGRGPSGLNEANEYFNLQLPNSNDPIMFKSGSAALTLNSNVTISGSLSVGGNLQFNVGDFYSTQTQTLAAGVSGSVTYNNTGTSFGVTLASSSRLTIANAGVYSITFSAQVKGDGGQDTIYIWLKKNGTNVADTATKIIAKNNEEDVMTVEYIVQAAASDYYEIAWQNTTGDGDLAYYAASGNIPAIPSIITSVKQVR